MHACRKDRAYQQNLCPGFSVILLDMVMHAHYFLLGVNGIVLEVGMTATLTVESTLTDRYQTTVPESVRRALHLGKRDKIRFTLQPDGKVVLSRVDESEDDPILHQFLDFLANDIANHPQHVQMLGTALAERIQTLVGHVEIDLSAPLSDKDE